MVANEILSVWPEWRIIEKIDEGSFGKVYKAVREDYQVTSYSAIKIISIPQNEAEIESLLLEGMSEKSTRSYFEKIVEDFIKEIKLANQMKGNTNIVSVEDYKVVEKENCIGWDIFIRMELLTSFVKYASNRVLEEEEVIKLGIDICSALEYCARKRIIHRDVKPENIFVTDFGDFKLGDFGIARELEKTKGSFSTKGTYNYMAPEILRSQQYDATVDTYSLGLVLYKLLNNNRLPFLDPYKEIVQYQERQEAITRRINGEPLPPPLHAGNKISAVIMVACSYDAKNRYQSAADMKRALENIQTSKDTSKSIQLPVVTEEPTLVDEDFSNTQLDISLSSDISYSKATIEKQTQVINTTLSDNKENIIKQKDRTDSKLSFKEFTTTLISILVAVIVTSSVLLYFLAFNKQKVASNSIKIGVVVYDFRDIFMTEIRNEMDRYVVENLNKGKAKYKIDFRDSENSQNKESEAVDGFIVQDYDVIIVNLVKPESAESIVNKCKDANIPLVFFHNAPPEEFQKIWLGKQTFVGANPAEAGIIQGQIIANLPNKGDLNCNGQVDYIMLTGDPSNIDARLRTEYSVKALIEAGIRVRQLEEYCAYWQPAQAENAMADFLVKYTKGDIDVIFANNDGMAMGAMYALEAAGWEVGKAVYLVGIDAHPEAADAVSEGRMTGTVLYDKVSLAHITIDVAIEAVSGKAMNQKYDIPYIPIVK